MFLCMTKKVRDHFKIKEVTTLKESDAYTWHVTYEVIDRRKYFTFCHVESGYMLLLLGIKPKEISKLKNIFITSLKRSLKFSGVKKHLIDAYIDQLDTLTLGKTVDKKIIAQTTTRKHDSYRFGDYLNTENMHQPIINFHNNHSLKYLKDSNLQAFINSFKPSETAFISYKVFELDITLNLEPEKVYRRVLVPMQYTLADLHTVIQKSFGWLDTHLYEFVDLSTKETYTRQLFFDDFREQKDAFLMTLEEAFEQFEEWQYIYDFGDYWEHHIFCRTAIYDKDPVLPQCIDFKGENIPEDVGGLPGYLEFKEAMSDPSHSEHTRYKEWFSSIPYIDFDIKKLNTMLMSEYSLELSYDLFYNLEK